MLCPGMVCSADGAKLNLIVVIHQMEKILKDVQSMIKQKAKTNLIEERVADLTNLVEGYSILVRNSSIKERNLKYFLYGMPKLII